MKLDDIYKQVGSFPFKVQAGKGGEEFTILGRDSIVINATPHKPKGQYYSALDKAGKPAQPRWGDWPNWEYIGPAIIESKPMSVAAMDARFKAQPRCTCGGASINATHSYWCDILPK